jgi:hypothetical protein
LFHPSYFCWEARFFTNIFSSNPYPALPGQFATHTPFALPLALN